MCLHLTDLRIFAHGLFITIILDGFREIIYFVLIVNNLLYTHLQKKMCHYDVRFLNGNEIWSNSCLFTFYLYNIVVGSSFLYNIILYFFRYYMIFQEVSFINSLQKRKRRTWLKNHFPQKPFCWLTFFLTWFSSILFFHLMW